MDNPSTIQVYDGYIINVSNDEFGTRWQFAGIFEESLPSSSQNNVHGWYATLTMMP
jgi:hypothetical protein